MFGSSVAMTSVSLEALETSSPTLIQTVAGWRGEISCVDVVGGRLAAAAGDTLKLWRWEKSAGWILVANVNKAHRYGVTSASWSPGGMLLATAGVDGVVRIWCGRTLTPRRLLSAPAAPAIRCVIIKGTSSRALSWAGSGRLVAGHDDGALCVWQAHQGALAGRLQAHQGALHALAACARGALLLAACTEGVLKVFDLQEICKCWEEGAPPPAPLLWADGAHDLGVLCAAASSDGRGAATGGRDGLVRLWATTGGGVKAAQAGAVLEGHGAAITSVCWSSSLVVVSTSLDRTARLWSPHTAACLCVIAAHTRYLTCVAVSPQLHFIITGSNDKTLRMWSFGAFTIDDELEPACIAHEHFGVGDLEGIGPVDVDDILDIEANEKIQDSSETSEGGAKLLWRDRSAHEGAVNAIAACKDLLVTASSDGTIKTYTWNSSTNTLVPGHTLGDKGYPILAVDLGASGALLLSAGLDTTAILWDVQSGCVLRSLTLPGGAEGGGGARGARLSGQLQSLIAADDGAAPVWSLRDVDPRPTHIYTGHPEACVCVAWSPDSRVCVCGGAAGELRVCGAPPGPLLVHYNDAHDLGVTTCDFAPSNTAGLEPPEGIEAVYLLATGGCDSLIKLWIIELSEDLSGLTASLRMIHSIEAHGGGVACVRWAPTAPSAPSSAPALLSSGGADRWARLWRLEGAQGSQGPEGQQMPKELKVVCAVPVSGAGGALATAFLDDNIIAVGTLSGELSLWRIPETEESETETECESETEIEPRWWGTRGVGVWLRQFVTRAPGSQQPREIETVLLEKIQDNAITGARLLDDPIEELLDDFGYGAEVEETEEVEQENSYLALRNKLMDEVNWLRLEPPRPELAWVAPHRLLCPLSHAVSLRPAHAADGCTYDCTALGEWLVAADGAISGVSGRKMRNAKILPNYKSREQLREFLAEHDNKEP